MNYGRAQKYLQEILSSGIKFGLDNVRTVLNSFENPHQQFPSILVAGTNGKGSVCAMLTEILSRQGFRVGLYTSPHLVRVEERIRIGPELISSRSFCRLLGVLKNKIEDLVRWEKLSSPPTYFEHLTCLALQYFAVQKVDMAVLEVGMGGRFDATNVVTPLISVITSVSMDHQEFLGRTLAEIAEEKAGIIKPGIPLVCGVSRGEASRIVRRRAKEKAAPFIGVFDREESFLAEKKRKGYRFLYKRDKEEYRFSPFLQGRHQGRNGAVAIAVAAELSKIWQKLDKKCIIQGVEEARWEGRLEKIGARPLVLLDGAHNEEGARALRDYVRDFLSPPLILVFAAMKDKDIRKMAGILFPLAEKIMLTHFPMSRAATPEEVYSQARDFRGRMFIEPDLRQAVQKAKELAGRQGKVLITGSLFLAGEVKKLFPQGFSA